MAKEVKKATKATKATLFEKVRDTVQFTASQLREVKAFVAERFSDDCPRISPEDYFANKFVKKMEKYEKKTGQVG